MQRPRDTLVLFKTLVVPLDTVFVAIVATVECIGGVVGAAVLHIVVGWRK